MTDQEAVLRARVAEVEAQLAAFRVVPQLPTEHQGEAIAWHPWEPALYPGLPGIRFNGHRCPGCRTVTEHFSWRPGRQVGTQSSV